MQTTLPPFASPRLPFGHAEADNESELYLEDIKRQARENVQHGYESIRVAWSYRWKKPKYDRFELYTPEEAILELWEQYYYENPKNVELAGLYKRHNPATGYAYYKTGDPELDKLEEEFGKGNCPDLSVLECPEGVDIWRQPVFVHDQHNIAQPEGAVVSARTGFAGVQKTAQGEKINTANGAKIDGTDFTNDEWLKEFEEDEFLKRLADKQGIKNG
jgi:hypothetical protein